MDPIADMLTQIKNAQLVKKEEILAPFSELKYQIAKILQKEGFVDKAEKKGKGIKKKIRIILKYKDKQPAITGLKKISKSGQRIYSPVKQIRPIREGFGIAIISTSKGIMTNREARKKKLGGEVLCEIW